MQELKKCLALMACGNQSYVEPSAVINAVASGGSSPFMLGHEQDINEFN
jgi:hypothetical protein